MINNQVKEEHAMITAEKIRAEMAKEKWTTAVLWFSKEEGLRVTNRTGWPILQDRDFPCHDLESLAQAIVAGGKFSVRTKIRREK